MAEYYEKDADSITKGGLLSRVYLADDADARPDTTIASKNSARFLEQQPYSRSLGALEADDSTVSSIPQSKKERHATILLIAAASALSCLLLLFAFTHVVPLPATLSRGGDILTCGNTSAEAVRRGCHFDAMLLAWTPRLCFDGAMLERYRAKTNWTWIEDPHHEGEVSDALTRPEEAHRGSGAAGSPSARRKALRKGGQEGGNGGWVTRWEFHLVHCAYTWELLERAYHGGDGEDVWVIPELYVEGPEHAEHCGELWSRVALYGIEREREFVSMGRAGTGLYTCARQRDL